MDTRRSIGIITGVALALAACNGDGGTGLDGDGDGDGREIKEQPSFAADVNEIFQRRGCTASQCHGGGQAGLTLTSSASANYAQLVDVQATSEDFLRVEPGNAQDSYLVIKLEGRQIAGAQMPLNGSPLDDIDLTNIKNWINNGAPNN